MMEGADLCVHLSYLIIGLLALSSSNALTLLLPFTLGEGILVLEAEKLCGRDDSRRELTVHLCRCAKNWEPFYNQL